MSLKPHFELMSRYNQWMNENIYEAASKLSDEQRKNDQGAFFGSMHGTLNHILVGDIIWLKRFADHPAKFDALNPVRALNNPTTLSQILHDSFDDLKAARIAMDGMIVNWCRTMDESDLTVALNYHNTKGEPHVKNFGHLVQHFFNHQTHHRGQITTLLNQSGIDVGVTDLLMIIPEE